MCFGSKSSPPAAPPAPSPGIIATAPVKPDYSRAAEYRGGEPPPNETGRVGGGLLLEAANKQQGKMTLGA